MAHIKMSLKEYENLLQSHKNVVSWLNKDIDALSKVIAEYRNEGVKSEMELLRHRAECAELEAQALRQQISHLKKERLISLEQKDFLNNRSLFERIFNIQQYD